MVVAHKSAFLFSVLLKTRFHSDGALYVIAETSIFDVHVSLYPQLYIYGDRNFKFFRPDTQAIAAVAI